MAFLAGSKTQLGRRCMLKKLSSLSHEVFFPMKVGNDHKGGLKSDTLFGPFFLTVPSFSCSLGMSIVVLRKICRGSCRTLACI
jgi:hypothetical protein